MGAMLLLIVNVVGLVVAGTTTCTPSSLYWDCCTVKSGDSISAIAERYNLDWRVVCDYNSVSLSDNCEALQIGDQLRIPNGLLAGYSCQATGSYWCYTLQDGDSFGTVSQKYTIPMAELQFLNPGQRQPFMKGSQVKVPYYFCQPSYFFACYFPPADTDVNALAVLLGYSAGTLLRANPDRISADTGFKIPKMRAIQIPHICMDRPGISCYKVRKGDTLNSVAPQFGLSASQLCHFNKISNCSLVYTDDEFLRVPVTSP